MFISRMIDEKRRYRRYKARTAALPASYRTAIDAIERYLMYFGPGTGDELIAMLEDLLELFDQSVASGSPIRSIVGDDPVEFVETFRRNYPAGQWIVREQQRLTRAIENSEHEEQSG